MVKRRCLVLGGCGFIGSYAAESLLAAGHRVRIFDRLHVNTENIAGFRGDVELVQGDLTNEADVDSALEGVEYVFHFASTTIPATATENPLFDLETNVGSSIKLLESARDRKVKKIIYTSSGGAVYGLPAKLPIREDHPTDPISAYGVSKLAIEKYLKLYAYLFGVDYLILRPSNPYGPRQNIANPQGALVHFLASLHAGKPIEIWGDGSVTRDYFFVADLLGLFPKLLSPDLRNGIYNVGSGKGQTLIQLLAAVRKALGRELDVRYIAGRKLDVPVNVLDARSLKRDAGWSASTGLSAGIRETWRWLEATAGPAAERKGA